MSLRIGFLGTGRLALPVFHALCDSNHSVCGLVTQPDRTGPGHHRHKNPLKDLAIERGIPVFQPVRIKRPEAVAELQTWMPELFVVAAYGQILSNEILELPRLGTINVHASLLPKYRGATPIHAAILNGDADAGITIIRLVQELDAGPMLGVVTISVGREETTGELESRLADLAPALTLNVIQELETGTAIETPQNHALATHVGKLSKADGRISWGQTAQAIERHIRGMQPWPGPFTQLFQADKPPLRMQILKIDPVFSDSELPAGSIVDVANDSFCIRCGDAALRVLTLHPDGKRPMSAAEFLRGRSVQIGDHCE